MCLLFRQHKLSFTHLSCTHTLLQGPYKIGVSHMTGNTSGISLNFMKGDTDRVAMIVGIILSYCFGAFLSAFMINDSKFHFGHGYDKVLFFQSILLCSGYLIFTDAGIFAEMLCAVACGMQNGKQSETFSDDTLSMVFPSSSIT